MSISGITSSDRPLETRVVSSGGYTYIGEAEPGTADADAAWRISRIDSSGNTAWADKNSIPNKVWDSGASEYLNYTYV